MKIIQGFRGGIKNIEEKQNYTVFSHILSFLFTKYSHHIKPLAPT